MPSFLKQSVDKVRDSIDYVNVRLLGRERPVPTKLGTIQVRAPSHSQRDIGKLIEALKKAESQTMPTRRLLYDIYHDMELDSDYTTALRIRKSAIHNLDLVYMINENDENEMTEWLKSPQWRKFKSEILDTIFWGHTLFQYDFTNSDDFFMLIPRKHVEPLYGHILQYEYDYKGIEYREVAEYEVGEIMEIAHDNTFGLLLKIAIPIIYKRNGQGDWATYSELAGNNFMIFEFTKHAEKHRQQIEKAAKEKGAAGVLTLPEGVSAETKNTSSASQNMLFKDFHHVHSTDILKIILGQSQTVAEGDQVGSYAKAKISLALQEEVHQDDRIFLLNFLNYSFKQVINNWTEFKGITQEGNFEFKESEETEQVDAIDDNLDDTNITE
jgi:hypothetical protein